MWGGCFASFGGRFRICGEACFAFSKEFAAAKVFFWEESLVKHVEVFFGQPVFFALTSSRRLITRLCHNEFELQDKGERVHLKA